MSNFDEIKVRRDTWLTISATLHDSILLNHGPCALAVWTYFMRKPEGWIFRKDHCLKSIKGMTDRAFRAAMKSLEEVGVAWKDKGGINGGTRWNVSHYPRDTTEALERDLAKLSTVAPNPDGEYAASLALSANTSPDPEFRAFTQADPRRQNRQLAKTPPLEKDQNLLKRDLFKNERETPAQPSVAHMAFVHFYDFYPRKRDRSRAEEVFIRFCHGMTEHEIWAFERKLEYIVGHLILTGVFNLDDVNHIPYAKSFLSGKPWEDELEPLNDQTPPLQAHDLDWWRQTYSEEAITTAEC